MRRLLRVLLAAGCLLGGISEAAAAREEGVTAELEVFKVVRSAAGLESLEAAESFDPGDIIEYRAVYTNRGAGTVRAYEGTMPLPPWAAYLPGTSKPAAVAASVDGKQFGTPPLTRRATRPDGREQTAEIPPSEYRFLRWKLGNLAPGASATGTFRVRVVTGDRPAGAKPAP